MWASEKYNPDELLVSKNVPMLQGKMKLKYTEVNYINRRRLMGKYKLAPFLLM